MGDFRINEVREVNLGMAANGYGARKPGAALLWLLACLVPPAAGEQRVDHTSLALGDEFGLAVAGWGECQLANPSFELPGTSGQTFAGWLDIGSVSASSSMVTHGHVSARLSGPDEGIWAMSGVGQFLDTFPGDRWAISARVGHGSADPLAGAGGGVVFVQWYDSDGGVIDEELHLAIDASAATDIMHHVEFETSPAPPGTATVLLVPGKLQSPANDPGSVFFDHVQFRSLTPPTVDEIQWNDFPSGRVIGFADRLWRVKGPGFYGPGPNLYAYTDNHVWVDIEDRLHLTIRKVGSSWYSTEIALIDPLRYGDYIFTTVGRLDTWAPNVVLGLYTWQYPMCWDQANPWNLHCEFDVEISRWGTPGDDVAQFVTQPWDYRGNLDRFGIVFSSDDQLTSFAFRYLPDRIEARSWSGGPHDESPDTLIHAWTYLGPHIPVPQQQRVHINFWQLSGPPADGRNHEVIIDSFVFVPSCVDDGLGHDWRCFEACLSGPDHPVVSGCSGFDVDLDGDVDLADFVEHENAFPIH